MEIQEEIISSWWVQSKALLIMCGVSQKRMPSIRARRSDLCPGGARFGRADARHAQFRDTHSFATRTVSRHAQFRDMHSFATRTVLRHAQFCDTHSFATRTVLLMATVRKLANALALSYRHILWHAPPKNGETFSSIMNRSRCFCARRLLKKVPSGKAVRQPLPSSPPPSPTAIWWDHAATASIN